LPKFVYVEKSDIPVGKQSVRGSGTGSGGGGGRSWRWRGKARQLHPDPAIRPSVKRAETIEKDKRDI